MKCYEICKGCNREAKGITGSVGWLSGLRPVREVESVPDANKQWYTSGTVNIYRHILVLLLVRQEQILALGQPIYLKVVLISLFNLGIPSFRNPFLVLLKKTSFLKIQCIFHALGYFLNYICWRYSFNCSFAHLQFMFLFLEPLAVFQRVSIHTEFHLSALYDSSQ